MSGTFKYSKIVNVKQRLRDLPVNIYFHYTFFHTSQNNSVAVRLYNYRSIISSTIIYELILI